MKSGSLTDRERAMVAACGDVNSAYYKNLTQKLREASSKAAVARAHSKYVSIPLPISDADVAALEKQFDVLLKVTRGVVRSRLTDRVAGLMYVLDASLLEHAGVGGRKVLVVDGDVMTMAAVGIERRMVERSNCHARAAFGYFLEDECVRKSIAGRTDFVRANAERVDEEMRAGGGEFFSPFVRPDGPRADSVVLNHFKTPVGLVQAAWLTHVRGGVGYGVIPFQMDMRVSDSGRLLCFPGMFYVDRVSDVITLIPDSDASMSISHPYSQLMEFVDNNSVSVDGVEYLCEKYMNVPGILYYTLVGIGQEGDVPETLRTHYFDASVCGVTEISFPYAKYSSEGVPVGFGRETVRVLTARLERVIARVSTSRNDVVYPSEVFIALMDYNNMTVNTLDSAVVAERMDEMQEDKIALGIALHVNWQRHRARGTLNTLLNAVKLRHRVADNGAFPMAVLALSAWLGWKQYAIAETVSEVIPSPSIADWCGNDFSVVIEKVNPWVVIEQDRPVLDAAGAVQHPWLPIMPIAGKSIRQRVLERVWPSSSQVRQNVVPVEHKKQVVKDYVSKDDKSEGPIMMEVVSMVRHMKTHEGMFFTPLKMSLREKLLQEQAAVNEVDPGCEITEIVSGVPAAIPIVEVPKVDPESSMRSDLDAILGGLPERDVVKTGYQLAEAEIDKVTSGCVAINDSKRNLPKPRMVRYPKVDAMVEGTRPPCSATLLGALFKRNVGIPNNRTTVNLDLAPRKNVDRVINTCFRDDWQEIVQRHLNTGMWQANESDIEVFLQNMNERKTQQMLDEFFSEGLVNLERWKLMAKGKVKPSREVGAESKVAHAQTIMFLESGCTNAMYSSITKRVKLCIDECLRENVKLNPQWNHQESEDWYNSMEAVRKTVGRTYSYSADSSVFDRSQDHPALMTEMEFYKVLGLDRHTYDIWIQTHGKKKAMSMMFGIVATIVLCGVSGLWKTLLRNGLVQLSALIVSADLRRSDIVTLEIKGDDMDGEFSRPIKVETAVENMSAQFNLNSKFNTNAVRYFCKNFRLKIMGRWIEVADPWVKTQSVCTPVWIDGTEAALIEKHVSLVADLYHYDNEIVLSALAEATQQFYNLPIAPYGLCRALATLRADRNAYMKMFNAPVLIY